MRNYFKYLVIGWSVACIGIFQLAFTVTKAQYQKKEHYITILKDPSKLSGSTEDLKIRAVWKELERRDEFSEFVAHAKAKADTAESIKYIEYFKMDDDFYWIFPLACFVVWSIPIVVFTLLGLLFKPK